MSGILDSMKSAFSTSGEDESDTSGIFSNVDECDSSVSDMLAISFNVLLSSC